MNEKAKSTIAILEYEKTIPSEGSFIIDEDLVKEYIVAYKSVCNNKKGLSGLSEKRLARKIAALNLMITLDSRNEKYECGFVYVIANPAWPEHLKIGMTTEMNDRLASYQTGDPHRKYYIKHYEFVLNRRETEKSILQKFNINIEKGEWIKEVDSKAVFDYIQTKINVSYFKQI